MKYVSYIRVSTNRQGVSGLGLEAQQYDIANYIASNPGELVTAFEEVESGTNDNRPLLDDAIIMCRQTGAKLLIAKLDRLSRDVHFITSLMKSGLEFTICNMPQADKFTIHIYAALAEREREMISERTLAALKAARARGVVLGNPKNLSKESASIGRELCNTRRKESADKFAEKVKPLIAEYCLRGYALKSIADELNKARVLTAGGRLGVWDATKVRNVLNRSESL
jgi:DNA invertase Pin-like site-specific DNA recombinase